MPTIHQLVSTFVHANSAHTHVHSRDAEHPSHIAQSCVSARNVLIKANVSDRVVRNPSFDAFSCDASIASDSGNAMFAGAITTTARSSLEASYAFGLCARPSIAYSDDSGTGSLTGSLLDDVNADTTSEPDHLPTHNSATKLTPASAPASTYESSHNASHRTAHNTDQNADHGVTFESRSAFIYPDFGHWAHATGGHATGVHPSLQAKLCAATLKPSQRLLRYLMADVHTRDVDLGKDCDRQEAASALKAMANNAEGTLHALGEENALVDRHCAFITSLQRCRTVLESLDDLHGYSKRSKHSSRRLIFERTCTALQGIHEKYDASKQLLIEAHEQRPFHKKHSRDLDLLLKTENVIALMRHGAGKSVAVHKRIAGHQTHLLELHRRRSADYAESFHRL